MLATALLIEFAKFLKIISWIVLPVLLATVLITVFIHYRRRKKQKAEDTGIDEKIFPASPEHDGNDGTAGAYVYFDHSGLIRQYKNKLSYNHAKYAALKQDFEKLELKYTAVIDSGLIQPFNNEKNTKMENTIEQLQTRILALTEDYNADKRELTARLEQLDRSYKSLEAENESLLEQINMQTATDDEKEIIVNRWKEENSVLRNQLGEQQYLRDLVEEKKAQIEFLQNQVEQRLKNYHLAEQQRGEIYTELEKLRQNRAVEMEAIKSELNASQVSNNKLKISVEEIEKQLEEKQQFVISKLDQITYLENVLQELREQNEMLNASVADNADRVAVLQQQLEDEQSRSGMLEQRLVSNRQLLHRLYKEFSTCIEEESLESPVVTLRPSYISKVNTADWDETAAQ